MYHQVLPASSEHFKSHIAVTPEVFRGHLEILRDEGFEIQTVKEFFTSKKKSKKVAILSFDDISSSFVEYAQPILQEFGYKASLFPIQNMSFQKKVFNLKLEGIRGLSEEEIKSLHLYGHEIGSHAQSHRNLHNLPFTEVEKELSGSKEWLEKIIQGPVHTVCYPIGGIDRDIIELSQKLGFKNGLTTYKCSLQLKSDIYTLRRINIKNETQGKKFKKAISPFYGIRRFLTRPFRSKYKVTFRHPSFLDK